MPELETLDSCLVQRTSPLKYRKKVRAFNPRSGQPQFRIEEETKRRYELEVNFNKADVRKQFIKFWHEHYPLETFLYHNKDFNEIAEFRIVSDLEEAGSGSRSGIFKFVIEEVNLMPDDFVAPSTPENLLIDNISLSGFDASWDAATDNVGVAGYRVVISGGIYSNHEIDVGNDTSPAVAVVLENGKIYVASVIAYDDAGNPSDPSSAVEFDTTMRLLDVMGHKDNGFAVFGLRKLRAAYSGMCFRLKRDSDDDETDIGFDSNGAYDLAAFNSFVDGTTYDILKKYDQSGAGNNLSLSSGKTSSKLINGAFVMEGASKYETPVIDLSTTDKIAMLGLYREDAVATNYIWYLGTSFSAQHGSFACYSPTSTIFYVRGKLTNVIGRYKSVVAAGGIWYLDSMRIDSSKTHPNDMLFRENGGDEGGVVGTAQPSGNFSSSLALYIGSDAHLSWKEMVFIKADVSSAQVIDGETDINDYYEVY